MLFANSSLKRQSNLHAYLIDYANNRVIKRIQPDSGQYFESLMFVDGGTSLFFVQSDRQSGDTHSLMRFHVQKDEFVRWPARLFLPNSISRRYGE